MKKILWNIWTAIFKFGAWFGTYVWWPIWSTIRFHKLQRADVPIAVEYMVCDLPEIQALLYKVNKKFIYTHDGPDQLWDAIVPPPQNYENFIAGEIRDDCDGFHSTVYHCLHRSGIRCYLLSVNAFFDGHCVLLFELDNKWYVADYTRYYGGCDTPKKAIELYNGIYKDWYNTKHEVVFNGVTEYDYEHRKFKGIRIKAVK